MPQDTLQWKTIGTKKRAGVLVPLFSIYSKTSVGIGDLSDLKPLIEWCAISGNSILQLLPMNEMGNLFCPYDSVSAFALEPAYMSLGEIPYSRDKAIDDSIINLRHIFAPSGYLDYTVKKEKLDLFWAIYQAWDHSDSSDLKKFREENAYWLIDFAVFEVLKNYHNGSPWYDWEDRFKNRDRAALENFQIAHSQEINFQIWLQWQLYRQFKDVRDYAWGRKVLLKGDLPILVSRDSSDVWAHPEFFKLDFAAGAPPDMYCTKGQRWGMPTYNWERIAADDFRYFKEKLKYAGNFYDILRIDHVVGLFRIWSIYYRDPLENQGLNGFFDPADESLWGGQGRWILKTILQNTLMLLCAEDLGVIPKVCTDTLKELGIPGNDVQRWVKDWKVKHDFLRPEDYRQLSVAMLSTHDTTNWPAWWENEAGTVDEALFMRKCNDHRQIDFTRVKKQLFDITRSRHGRLRWQAGIDSVDKLVAILGKRKEELADFIDLYQNTYLEKEKLWRHLGFSGKMREKSDADIVRQALKLSLSSSAIFCVNTLTDYLYLSDIFKGDPYLYRINTPGTISNKNWSLTMPIPLEELLKHKVNKEIRKLITASGRI